MALTIGMIEVIIEFTLARAAFQLRPVLERSGKIFNRCCGGMFAGIGLALPLVTKSRLVIKIRCG
ncbi:hypothetical protein [Aliamphritea spongicola]|nr:hypothetical protein [Aliamphritea spongicola]